MGDHKMYNLEYEVDSFSLREELRVATMLNEAIRDEKENREIWKALHTTAVFMWDDYEEDMRRFSKMFPEVLFTVDIAGFEPYDISRVYFQDGKMQKAKVDIKYSDMDEDYWE